MALECRGREPTARLFRGSWRANAALIKIPHDALGPGIAALRGAPFPKSHAGVITLRKTFEDKAVYR